jgi:hypothetical protein
MAAAGITLTATGRPTLAAGLPRKEASRIAAVIFDPRYSDAREFAAALERRGAVAHPISFSAAWHHELATVLAERGGMVAGMSTDADLFVAKSLCRDIGLCVVFEASHDARGSSRVTHLMRMRGDARHLNTSIVEGDLRPGQSATAMACSDFDMRHGWSEARAEGPRSQDHPGYLTSWLLAPRPA